MRQYANAYSRLGGSMADGAVQGPHGGRDRRRARHRPRLRSENRRRRRPDRAVGPRHGPRPAVRRLAGRCDRRRGRCHQRAVARRSRWPRPRRTSPPPDILVASAGITGPNATVIQYPVDAWKQVIDINLTGVFLSNRAVAPGMAKRGWGRIVNIASVAGKEGNPNASAYSASKAGVIGLTKSLGKELATTRRAGELRGAGGGEDGVVQPDDRAAHPTTCCPRSR